MQNIGHKPSLGTEILLSRGDVLEFRLELPQNMAGSAWLRANVTGAEIRRREIVDHVEYRLPVLTRDWRDFPMRRVSDNVFSISIPFLQTGRFEAKAFFLPDHSDRPLWPEGKNIVIKVEPADTCCSNTMYTAFVRQFGRNQQHPSNHGKDKSAIEQLESRGYNIIPRSGTFRDLIKELDFIMGRLRYRIVQLLPIHPIPTTYARMGRFGSPFAALDFMDVDPALAEFDRKTTPMDQFQELIDAVHERGGKLFIDIPVNHTGWASRLQKEHPEWFARDHDRAFKSPGAWGVTWEDLSKLDYQHSDLWQYMAGVFLFWCRHGVDGFRCDAGYMLPFEAWEYMIAKTRCEFPDTVFLLEGLGGKLEVVNRLLIDANMDWAYSELFQNYDRSQIETYLPGCIHTSLTKGLLMHFAETHDNNRLAASSAVYARMRTALSAMFSSQGAFGITNGVEWFAEEKIDVHDMMPINWGSKKNQVDHITRLNVILETHPAFHSGSHQRLIETGPGNILAMLRQPAGSSGHVLVLVNLDEAQSNIVTWKRADYQPSAGFMHDLITGEERELDQRDKAMLSCGLSPGEVLCLTGDKDDLKRLDSVPDIVVPRRAVSQSLRAKVLELHCLRNPGMDVSGIDPDAEAEKLAENPRAYCEALCGSNHPSNVVMWEWPRDTKRVVMVPPGCCLLINSRHRFIAELRDSGRIIRRELSLPKPDGSHFAIMLPYGNEFENARMLTLAVAVYEPGNCRRQKSDVLYLADSSAPQVRMMFSRGEIREKDSYAICANRRGAMAQVRGAWGEIQSQYDAFLAANLHPDYPVDRHVMFTRCKAWLVRHGYYNDIDYHCLENFMVDTDGSVQWQFTIPAGQGELVHLDITLKMKQNSNAVMITFDRREADDGKDSLADDNAIEIIVRPDIEDRNAHGKTKAYTGPEKWWGSSISCRENGFMFTPVADRRLNVSATAGVFTSEPEWTYMVPHPFDADRGFDGSSDLFSPGYFRFYLKGGQNCRIDAAINEEQSSEPEACCKSQKRAKKRWDVPLEEVLRKAIRDFVVSRDNLETVIAGYPWFLDWGRDTLICLRGMVAAGMLDVTRDILREFARFEYKGTLPNAIHGNDASDRDTSDAPLWFFVACSDLTRAEGTKDSLDMDCGGRTIRQVLKSIAASYINGTPNRIKMDADSGLVFSPSHFTWMDTNYPAGTPREGYPVEIQALWYSALSFLAELEPEETWAKLAAKTRESIMKYFFDAERGYLADCLHAAAGQPAKSGKADDALRPNQLLAITLGAVEDFEIRRRVITACEELLVPGAVRSVADKSVTCALPVYHNGKLLNNPANPYWGQYCGDEDTRRKPAYHNGTAWTWLFPSFPEALLITYGNQVRSRARAILLGSIEIINKGCIGHVPEIMDGNLPHILRGCGAQAWGATELYRVLAFLSRKY